MNTSQVSLTQLITKSQEPGVERILAHEDYRALIECDGLCEVNIHNGTVDKYVTDEATYTLFMAHVQVSNKWHFTLSPSHPGFMARPVMTEAQTEAVDAAWNDRHDPAFIQEAPQFRIESAAGFTAEVSRNGKVSYTDKIVEIAKANGATHRRSDTSSTFYRREPHQTMVGNVVNGEFTGWKFKSTYPPELAVEI
jgi:hypothetical protein